MDWGRWVYHAFKDDHQRILKNIWFRSCLSAGKSVHPFPLYFFFKPFYSKRGEGRKLEQTPSGKIRTQSLITIELSCKPLLAGVRGPWGRIRDVLSQPHSAWWGPGLVSCSSLQLCGILQYSGWDPCKKGAVGWVLWVEPGGKSQEGSSIA